MPNMIRQKGMTLIELIIVIVLVSILAAGASQLFRQGFLAYIAGEQMIDADWQGRTALGRMTRDLHTIRASADITNATASIIAFIDMHGTSITYQVSGTQLMRNAQALADNVQSVELIYYDENEAAFIPNASTRKNIRYIKITLKFDYYISFDFVTGVTLWNMI